MSESSSTNTIKRTKVFLLLFLQKKKSLLAFPFLLFLTTAAQAQPLPGQFGSPGHFTESTGAAVYQGVCAGCHMANGQGARGAGAYPALAGDPRLAVPAYAIGVVLRGRGAMPGFARVLDNRQIADVVTWLRQNLGNAYPGGPSPDDVQALR
jgi:mono/diheme cytochrome c family protein